MPHPNILLTREGAIALITLDRAAKRNAMDLPMWIALAALIASLHTAEGRVSVDGFYDDVQELTADRFAVQVDGQTYDVVLSGDEDLPDTDITPAEAVTVVLSEKGWVRAAKGHDIDAAGLSYKAGDGYLAKAEGKSNQLVHFLDSVGRSYSLSANTLPSARAATGCPA